MTLFSLYQMAQAAAVSAADNASADYLVRGAIALILALQGYLVRTVNTLSKNVGEVTTTVYGRNNKGGLEQCVEEHSAELMHIDRRVVKNEDWIEREDRRKGPSDRRAD